MAPFQWRRLKNGNEICLWQGFTLVTQGGRWWVYDYIRDGLYEPPPVANWSEQVMGEDTQDAQRRAQAAAMVLHQLRQQ